MIIVEGWQKLAGKLQAFPDTKKCNSKVNSSHQHRTPIFKPPRIGVWLSLIKWSNAHVHVHAGHRGGGGEGEQCRPVRGEGCVGQRFLIKHRQLWQIFLDDLLHWWIALYWPLSHHKPNCNDCKI